VPPRLQQLIEAQPGQVHRDNAAGVDVEFAALGVGVDGQFAEFFRRYRVTLFRSVVSDEQLCDIADPTPEIAIGTRFVQEVWKLPQNFICLTSVQGEGAYLYDVSTEAVWNFSLSDRDNFVSGKGTPAWASFYDFLTWYLEVNQVSE
jgi:hypothetical protein